MYCIFVQLFCKKFETLIYTVYQYIHTWSVLWEGFNFRKNSWSHTLPPLINFLGFQGGRSFEVGAYSKVGAYSNKYGIKGSNFLQIAEYCIYTVFPY